LAWLGLAWLGLAWLGLAWLYCQFQLCGLEDGKNAAGNIRLYYCVAEFRLVSSCLKLLYRKIFVVSVNCE